MNYPYVSRTLFVRVAHDGWDWWYHVKDCMKVIGYSAATISSYRNKTARLSPDEFRWLSVPGERSPHLYVNWKGFHDMLCHSSKGEYADRAASLYEDHIYPRRFDRPKWTNTTLAPGYFWLDKPVE